MPSSQFFDLPREKQQEIMQACLSEFAEYGYDLASTNRIIQKAGISKGVLFKYFNDKKALFLYVFAENTKGYLDTIAQQPVNDLFEWIETTTLQKLRFLLEHPLIYQLWMRVAKDRRHPVYACALEQPSAQAHQFVGDIERLLPQGQLCPGLTWQHVLELLGWMGQGLQEKFLAWTSDHVDGDFAEAYQSVVDEMNVYLEILKYGIYREVKRP